MTLGKRNGSGSDDQILTYIFVEILTVAFLLNYDTLVFGTTVHQYFPNEYSRNFSFKHTLAL